MTDNCLLCQEHLHNDITWSQLFRWQPLDWPVVCNHCQKKFEKVASNGDNCEGCSRPLKKDSLSPYHQPHLFNNKSYCLDCRKWLDIYPAELVRHQPIFVYNDFFKDWLYRYKYHGDMRLAKVMVPFLKELKKQYQNYAWVPVPSSSKSFDERGFYPTVQLLKEAGITPCKILMHCGDGSRQAQKSKKERMNLGKIFQVDSQLRDYPDKLIIFDDLYTTGATMIQAKDTITSYYWDHFEVQPEIKSISLARDILKE